MIVEYTGRGLTKHGRSIGPKEKALADTELARIDAMLQGRVISAHVILTEDKYRQIAEITLQMAAENLVARCEGTEMLVALHDALKKIEQQAIKHKERRMTVERQRKPNSSEPMIEVPSVSIATAS